MQHTEYGVICGGSDLDSADRQLYAAQVALVAAAYYGSAKLGLKLAFESGSVTAVWPPTGIALAAVVLSRSGWGLYLVDQLADRWGVTPDAGGAWFEIDRA